MARGGGEVKEEMMARGGGEVKEEMMARGGGEVKEEMMARGGGEHLVLAVSPLLMFDGNCDLEEDEEVVGNHP
ncbi:hypothetical protein RRG08_012926 [Elysia crispata]|uniref:Uncharacterized protein n=1 Tax=Elysia crispata TaxID=231223 RepID=A0AAE1DPS5_9GAST|nr:hypothetical protein RRG08_012926 [Elysia crispata]